MGSVAVGAAWVAANATTIGAVATAAGAGASAYESHQQGVAAANADKQKARVAQDQATQQQITTRQNMLRALAAQNARAGVGGVGVSQADAMRQITQSQNDLMISQANSSAETSLLDQAGSEAESAGNIGAFSDLASGAASLAKNWPKGSGAPPVTGS